LDAAPHGRSARTLGDFDALERVLRKKINPKEFDAVTALPAERRYQHFVDQLADWEELWGLRNEKGWALFATEDGAVCFPVWPHEPYAAAFATGEFASLTATAIPLDEWTQEYLPNMHEDGTLVAVFPVTRASETGTVVSAERLSVDITTALRRYE
jgi:hypothetical protein